jgi:hypothetical protein
MNILFLNDRSSSLEGTFKGIQNAHTGEDWGNPSWLFLATARDQRARLAGSCKGQDKQLVAGWFWDRFHVRIWDLGDNVIAGAHHENLLTIGGNPPRLQPHKPDAFESGKVAICTDFRLLRNVVANGLWLDNETLVPYCSGYAAVIG